jgi:hypothetical protein
MSKICGICLQPFTPSRKGGRQKYHPECARRATERRGIMYDREHPRNERRWLGDRVSWQHCTPVHLPPVTLRGVVVGSDPDGMVVQANGARYSVPTRRLVRV